MFLPPPPTWQLVGEQGLQKSDRDLPINPGVLMAPAAEEGGGAALGVEDMPDDMQVGAVTWRIQFSVDFFGSL